MGLKAYTTTDPIYKGRDAVVFIETPGRFRPIYCSESANWELQIQDIARTSILGFFDINMKFYTDFASRIVDKLNNKGKEQLPVVLQEVFGQQPEPD